MLGQLVLASHKVPGGCSDLDKFMVLNLSSKAGLYYLLDILRLILIATWWPLATPSRGVVITTWRTW